MAVNAVWAYTWIFKIYNIREQIDCPWVSFVIQTMCSFLLLYKLARLNIPCTSFYSQTSRYVVTPPIIRTVNSRTWQRKTDIKQQAWQQIMTNWLTRTTDPGTLYCDIKTHKISHGLIYYIKSRYVVLEGNIFKTKLSVK